MKRIVEKAAAIISDDGLYRYRLDRVWDPDKCRVVFVGLNPSTADATQDDPTVRRWRGFAKAWGYGGFIVVNAYAYRATSPAVLKDGLQQGANMIGPENDVYLKSIFNEHTGVVVCWGANIQPARSARVRELLALAGNRNPLCFGLTKRGHPKHPLYLSNDVLLERWDP